MNPQGQKCHYCPATATTRDHVVPRSRLAPQWRTDRRTYQRATEGTPNLVPACAPCNGRKSDLVSTCRCPICTEAWELYGPEGWRELQRVDPAWGLPSVPRKAKRRRRRGRGTRRGKVKWKDLDYALEPAFEDFAR